MVSWVLFSVADVMVVVLLCNRSCVFSQTPLFSFAWFVSFRGMDHDSRRPLSTPDKTEAPSFSLGSAWNEAGHGCITAVDIVPGMVAVGTDMGGVHVFTYGGGRHVLRQYLIIPSPPSNEMAVVACKISTTKEKASVFVAYRRRTLASGGSAGGNGTSSAAASPRSTAGVSCFDIPLPSGPSPTPISAPSARHDLDGRNVLSSSLCDAVVTNKDGVLFTVARPDGLYTYSTTQKVDVAPIDGSKLAICLVPPPKPAGVGRPPAPGKSGSSFALVASTDTKSRRDAVDIYDATNKLVVFHLLLSPGHTAVRAAGVTTPPTRTADGSLRSGRSSAIVFTSGGSLVTLTEKGTAEKVNLLVQKNLYSAAIFVSYCDPSYETEDITLLYRRHAEYLYRKGDYSGAIDQYIHTIGSLEPSHVIFRYLDAPKIPLLVKYLEELRSRNLTTPVHNELLRTCYLKLNDPESAEAISAFTTRSMDTESLSNMVANSPKDALATICSFEAPQAAEALVVYGATLARLLPREAAGLVISLCFGKFSPRKLSESSATIMADTKRFLEHPTSDGDRVCDPYPVHIFASAFMENPRMLRLILTHCNRNRCPLTPSLRRTLLELTLAEWNQAKRTGDTEAEKLRRKEAIAALTDSHHRDIGDYDALVIVQLAGFEDGELLLYERLQMGSMLLARYAKDGTEKARRQMLAMCQSDPEILADVLGHFVNMVTERLADTDEGDAEDGDESDDEVNDILEDIQETLALARRQGVLPSVRIARILAGEGTGQFSAAEISPDRTQARTVPLSVALDYVGEILDESRKEISRLKIEVEEYNHLCNSMEAEIDSLLKASQTGLQPNKESDGEIAPRINIEEMYAKVRSALDEGERPDGKADQSREAFWREMDQSEDSFQTIARFFTKGVIQ
jgi:vacuolar protein sorting-associated protein 11